MWKGWGTISFQFTADQQTDNSPPLSRRIPVGLETVLAIAFFLFAAAKQSLRDGSVDSVVESYKPLEPREGEPRQPNKA